MTQDNFDAAYVVAAVLGLSAAAAVLAGPDKTRLHLAPVPAVTVTIARPCVFLAYDPGLNAYVCLDGAAAPLPAQPAPAPCAMRPAPTPEKDR